MWFCISSMLEVQDENLGILCNEDADADADADGQEQ